MMSVAMRPLADGENSGNSWPLPEVLTEGGRPISYPKKPENQLLRVLPEPKVRGIVYRQFMSLRLAQIASVVSSLYTHARVAELSTTKLTAGPHPGLPLN
jgi:hypothetical protein